MPKQKAKQSDSSYFNIGKKPNQTSLEKFVAQMTREPTPDKGFNVPKHTSSNKDGIHQLDLLFLPHDGKYKYLLVAVDIATRSSDFEPIIDKKSSTVVNAIKNIYDRKYLDIPYMFQVDDGSEFKDEFKKYVNDNNRGVRTAQTARHRQQSIVEKWNQFIGKALNYRMVFAEIETGKPNREWVKNLPRLRKFMNDNFKRKPKEIPFDEPVCKGNSCDLLDVGTVVHVQLDKPRAIGNTSINERFRTGDLRWSDPALIDDVLLTPGLPPLYVIDGYPNVAYTKNQLLIARDQTKPELDEGEFEIYRFREKRKKRNNVEYLIEYKGYPKKSDFEWKSRAEMAKLLGESTVRRMASQL